MKALRCWILIYLLGCSNSAWSHWLSPSILGSNVLVCCVNSRSLSIFPIPAGSRRWMAKIKEMALESTKNMKSTKCVLALIDLRITELPLFKSTATENLLGQCSYLSCQPQRSSALQTADSLSGRRSVDLQKKQCAGLKVGGKKTPTIWLACLGTVQSNLNTLL